MRKIGLFIILFASFTSISQTKTVVNNQQKNYEELLKYVNTIKIIDAHEHILSPEEHVNRYLSFYNFLTDYVRWDLYGAGLPKKYLNAFNPRNRKEEIALFDAIEPYLPYIENGSYMLSVKVALKKFFGFDKITHQNYLEIGQKLNEANTVENYRKIFKDANIVKLLEQPLRETSKDSLFANITTLGFQFKLQEKVTEMCRENKKMTLQEVIDFYDVEIGKEKKNGSVGIKFFPHVFIEPYDSTVAVRQFEEIKNGKTFNQRSTLARYIYEKQIEIATKNKMVVAIHLGVWANLTDKTPSILFPIVEKYPETTFDIYHMGIPYIRETAFLGKNYPNVYLNMCWAHSVSESMVLNSLDEWIDIVPTNKIIAFGGDVLSLPQHAVGMLEVAKQNICLGLARRIERNRLDMPSAKKILDDWFYNNPARIYNIQK
jgi:uncharacterized protein